MYAPVHNLASPLSRQTGYYAAAGSIALPSQIAYSPTNSHARSHAYDQLASQPWLKFAKG